MRTPNIARRHVSDRPLRTTQICDGPELQFVLPKAVDDTSDSQPDQRIHNLVWQLFIYKANQQIKHTNSLNFCDFKMVTSSQKCSFRPSDSRAHRNWAFLQHAMNWMPPSPQQNKSSKNGRQNPCRRKSFLPKPKWKNVRKWQLYLLDSLLVILLEKVGEGMHWLACSWKQ